MTNLLNQDYYPCDDILEPALINKIYQQILKDQKNATESEKLLKMWSEVNKTYRNVFLNDKKVNLVKISTGAGKTANIIQWILYFLRYTMDFKLTPQKIGIALLGQQYQQGVEEFQKQIEKFSNAEFPVNFIKFEGKNKLCLYKNYPIFKKGEEIGLSFSSKCKNCDKYDSDCPFYCNCRNLNPPTDNCLCLTVSHQLNKYIPIWLKRLDKMIIIIDENFETAIKINEKIAPSHIKGNIRFIKKIIKSENKRKSPDVLFIDDIEVFLDILLALKEGIDKEIDYKRLREALEMSIYLERDVINRLEDRAWKILEKADEEGKNPYFKKFLFYHILSLVKNYHYGYDKLNKEQVEIWLKRAIFTVKNIKENKTHLSMVFFDYYGISALRNNDKIIKIIINDATASVEKLKSFFGEELIIYEKTFYSCPITIKQLKKKWKGKYGREHSYYPQSSLKQIPTLKLLIGVINAYMYAFPEIKKHLILSRNFSVNTKEQVILIKDYLKANLVGEFVWAYYPLAGTNEYEKFQSVIVLGTPDLSDGVIKRESDLMWLNTFNPDTYREETALNTILQGIGRIFRGEIHKYVLMLTGIDLNTEGVELDTFPEQKTLIQYLTEIGDKKRNKAKETDFDKITKFMDSNGNKEITIKECMELFEISYKMAKKELNYLIAKKMLKIKLIVPSAKGGRPQAVYYL